ncbi:MAG: ParB/RepB/Spo0J family partition protein [Dietzia sp.]
MSTQTVTSEFALVDVDHVHPHPRNVRRQVTGVAELAKSIAAGGLHQPLVVAPADPDNDSAGYTLVMGHRRLAAVQSLGWSEVPCVIRHDLTSETQVLEAMLAENMARADLTVTEEGDAVQALLDLDVTPTKIAKAIGRTAKHVKDRAQIAGLTDKARQAVDDGQITITDALHLSKLDDEHELAAKVEGAIGTPNFRYTLERALQEAAFNHKRATILAELEESGATITDDAAEAGDDEIRIFLAQRPDDVTNPQISVYVSEYVQWGGNTAPRVQWIQIRPRAEGDPQEASTFYGSANPAVGDDEGEGEGDTEETDAEEDAREAAAEALRDEELRAERQEREDRKTAQSTRHRWLHEKWRGGMTKGHAGTQEQQLRDLIQVRKTSYETISVERLAPIVAGPDGALDVDDPELNPAGWPVEKMLFAAWWIHVGWGLDDVASRHPRGWNRDTVGFLENLAISYDYPLSEVEEADLARYAEIAAAAAAAAAAATNADAEDD